MHPHLRLPTVKLHSSIVALAASVVLFAAGGGEAAAAQPADTGKICTGGTQASPDDRIGACSSLIGAQAGDNERLSVLLTSRGSAWRQQGDLDRALADHDEAIRLQPGSALLYFNRAITWMSKNDADRAIADFTAAIRLAPGFTLAYRNRGDLLYGKGNFSSAMADYNRVISFNARDPRALAMRGLTKWQLGDIGGKADIAAAMRIDAPTTVALVSAARPADAGVATAVATQAAAVAPTIWDFKGSRVALETDGADRRFHYDTPRPELVASGITTGTLLFEGRQNGDQYTGKAFVFSRKCGARSFEAGGPVSEGPSGKAITLSGKRPLVDANCHPTGQFQNDVLVFSYSPPN